MKNKKKGFTLVELIVVLAILAILAAMLVPALTGYIDKANEKKAVAAARQYAIAAQSVVADAYAANDKITEITVTKNDGKDFTTTISGSNGSGNISTTNQTKYSDEFKSLAEMKKNDTCTFKFDSTQKMTDESTVNAGGINVKFDGTSWSKS